MLKYKDIIVRSYVLHQSGVQIAKDLKCSKSGVNDFLTAFRKCEKLSFPLPENITDEGIYVLVYSKEPGGGYHDPSFVYPDYSHIYEQMQSRQNMTLIYLWNRYMKKCSADGKKAYSYRQFCDNYQKWLEENDKTIHQTHYPGQSMEVDFAGKTFRIPRKEPKTFGNFDFSRIHGKDVEVLKNISTLAPLYAKKNMAFIGPQGIGKTHMAMAFGRAVCEQRMKAYFLKATELNQKLTNARKYGNVASVTNGLVRPSCLIIDEVGRCVFDEANTQIFFDIIDRRSNKEGPNCMIFTSNKNPSTWGKYFIEQDSLLCALDRFFDDSMVFMIKGESYRGRKTETISLEAGISKSIK